MISSQKVTTLLKYFSVENTVEYPYYYSPTKVADKFAGKERKEGSNFRKKKHTVIIQGRKCREDTRHTGHGQTTVWPRRIFFVILQSKNLVPLFISNSFLQYKNSCTSCVSCCERCQCPVLEKLAALDNINTSLLQLCCVFIQIRPNFPPTGTDMYFPTIH